jgi:hypothetical protein
MLSATIRRTIATTLSGAAIAGTVGAPAALAMPATDVGQGRSGDTQIVSPTPRSNARATAETTPGVGFDVSSAAIGAGLLIVTLAAGGLAWRRPITRRHGAAGA